MDAFDQILTIQTNEDAHIIARPKIDMSTLLYHDHFSCFRRNTTITTTTIIIVVVMTIQVACYSSKVLSFALVVESDTER